MKNYSKPKPRYQGRFHHTQRCQHCGKVLLFEIGEKDKCCWVCAGHVAVFGKAAA